MSQLSLFSSKSPVDMVQDRGKKPIPATSRTFEQKRVHEPYGKPDKRGKRAYERFEVKSKSLSPKAKEKFLDLLQTTNTEILSEVIELGEFWRKCSPLECEDIARSYGI